VNIDYNQLNFYFSIPLILKASLFFFEYNFLYFLLENRLKSSLVPSFQLHYHFDHFLKCFIQSLIFLQILYPIPVIPLLEPKEDLENMNHHQEM